MLAAGMREKRKAGSRHSFPKSAIPSLRWIDVLAIRQTLHQDGAAFETAFQFIESVATRGMNRDAGEKFRKFFRERKDDVVRHEHRAEIVARRAIRIVDALVREKAARVLIIEKSAEFDRKVGESTTELSSCYMTRLLGLTNYLGHHHLAKQGLRMWFANRPDQPFDDCVELGAKYQARLPTFQMDRSTLDQHMLDEAVAAGCEVRRPAKVTALELEGNRSYVSYDTYRVSTRWLVDASGRGAILARKLGHFHQNLEHPINAVWARFTGVKDWDSYEWREKFRDYANACRTSRNWATNHLMGHGWWCWIIPLRGGDVSAGIVYDSRIFKLPEGPSLSERLRAHLLSHPVGAEIFGGAQVIEHDVHAFSAMPCWSGKVCH